MIKMRTGVLVPHVGKRAGSWDHAVAGQGTQRPADRGGLRATVAAVVALPTVESFKLVKGLHDVPAATYEHNRAMFTELLGMEELRPTPVRQLSLGRRMRADLAAAMLYESAVWYLDEPTIGLDVVAKGASSSFLAELSDPLGLCSSSPRSSHTAASRPSECPP